MDIKPLRKNYGITLSFTIVLILVVVGLLAVNSFIAQRPESGASFYGYHLAGKVFFSQDMNPYAVEYITQTVSHFPDNPNISGFTLPHYMLLLVLPVSFIKGFSIALVPWLLVLEAAMIYAALRLKKAFLIGDRTISAFVLVLALLLNYYSVISLIEGDAGILAVGFVLIAVSAIREHDDEFAGILLAFATVKYNLTVLPILWICIWCIGNRRGTVLLWLGLVFGLLVLFSTLVEYSWIMEFLRAIVYYFKYLNPMNLARIIENWQPELGGRIGWGISIIFTLVMLVEWIINWNANWRSFEWVLALTFTVNFLCGIPNIGKNLFALWIPLIYALDKIVLRWEVSGTKISTLIAALFFFVPWIVQVFFLPSWDNPINMLCILLPVTVFILLYWNRWWNIDAFVENY